MSGQSNFFPQNGLRLVVKQIKPTRCSDAIRVLEMRILPERPNAIAAHSTVKPSSLFDVVSMREQEVFSISKVYICSEQWCLVLGVVLYTSQPET